MRRKRPDKQQTKATQVSMRFDRKQQRKKRMLKKLGCETCKKMKLKVKGEIKKAREREREK